jgi:hypothetical protein
MMSGVKIAKGDTQNCREERHESEYHYHADHIAGVHTGDEPPDEFRFFLEQQRARLQTPNNQAAEHDRRGGRAGDSQRDHRQDRRDSRRMSGGFRRNDSFDLAFTEAIGIL